MYPFFSKFKGATCPIFAYELVLLLFVSIVMVSCASEKSELEGLTFKEQLEDPYFEALGGFNIFSADAYGLTPSKTIEKLERVKKKIKAENSSKKYEELHQHI